MTHSAVSSLATLFDELNSTLSPRSSDALNRSTSDPPSVEISHPASTCTHAIRRGEGDEHRLYSECSPRVRRQSSPAKLTGPETGMEPLYAVANRPCAKRFPRGFFMRGCRVPRSAQSRVSLRAHWPRWSPRQSLSIITHTTYHKHTHTHTHTHREHKPG